MAAPTIAIDFGTTRTKVAYYDADRGKPELIEIGREIRAIVPSTFYIPPDGQGDRLVGDDAQDRCETDPEGVVIGLKKEINRLGKKHFGPGRRSVSRVELASDMFSMIRRVCRDEVFHSDVTCCVLTVPVAFEEQKRECIRQAAELGGFRDVKVVEEPVSAAQAWLAQSADKFGDHVIVCDVGGGTTDWALLQYVDHRFEQIPEVPPAGSTMGGNDVDEDMFEELLGLQGSNWDRELAIRQKAGFLIKLRRLRERLTQDQGPEFTIPVGAIRMRIPRGVVEQRTKEFVNRVKEETQRFLVRCRQVGTFEGCPVLLVGGASRLPGLKESLETMAPGPVLFWNDSDYATVLGAVEKPSVKPARAPAEPELTKLGSSQVDACSAERIDEMVGDGRCEEAFEVASEALALKPDDDVFDIWRSIAASVSDSLVVLGRAREIYRNRHADLWSTAALAIALSQVNRRDEARSVLAPSHPQIAALPYPLQWAWLEILSQDANDANYLGILDRLLATRPDNCQLLTYKALALVNYKSFARAENEQLAQSQNLLDRALFINPFCVDALLGRALLLLLRQTSAMDREAACTLLRNDLIVLERVARNHVYTRFLRGMYRKEMLDYQGAKSEFELVTNEPRWMSSPVGMALAFVLLAQVNLLLNDTAGAQRDVREALRWWPASVDALLLLGQLSLDRPAAAVSRSARTPITTRQIVTQSAAELVRQGRDHVRRKRFDKAASDFEAAACIDSETIGLATWATILDALAPAMTEIKVIQEWLFIDPDIPAEKVKQAAAKLSEPLLGYSKILLLYDATPFLAGFKHGFYITDRDVVWKGKHDRQGRAWRLYDVQGVDWAESWEAQGIRLAGRSGEHVVLPMPNRLLWDLKSVRPTMRRLFERLGELHRRVFNNSKASPSS